MNDRKTSSINRILIIGLPVLLILMMVFAASPRGKEWIFCHKEVSGLQGRKENAGTILLEWEPVEGADGYEICRARPSDGKVCLIGNVISGRTSVYADRVNANYIRTYTVRAFKRRPAGDIVYCRPGTVRAGGLNGSETIGHRGAMDMAPDDTIASFEKARKLGYKVFECDLFYTRSKDLFIYHDPYMDLLTGKEGPVTKLTADNYLSYPISKGKNADWYPMQYPQELDTVLAWAHDNDMDLIIHFKDFDVSYDDRVFREIEDSLKRYDMTDRACVFTSGTGIIKKMSRYHFRRGFLMSFTTRGQRRHAVKIAAKYGCELIIMKYTDQMPINIDMTRYAHDYGLRVGCYNITRTDQLHHVIRSGLDYWILNRALIPGKKNK